MPFRFGKTNAFLTSDVINFLNLGIGFWSSNTEKEAENNKVDERSATPLKEFDVEWPDDLEEGLDKADNESAVVDSDR